MRTKNLLSRLRDCPRDERGAINVVLIGVLVVILTLGAAIIVPIGHTLAERRSATTAADAAALAGADYCADRLEDAYSAAMRSTDDKEFWAHFGKPVSFYCGNATTEAQHMALANNASLTSFRMTIGLRFQASITRHEEVTEVGGHLSSRATAKMDMRTGACVSGGLFGIRISGTCRTSPPTVSPGSGWPLEPGTYSPVARIDTELVVS
ncbi:MULTISPECIES: pilus assembly protein TadG-related protein [Actinomyces]|uniref:Putative Flp pilus-assembly TadG-like N-terminal domain-containing protein n=1 Tax=Actinomyces respiraculi TaxID=2744574 RepID=A0A7T0PVT8_9ACTO|nr:MULTISPECIES: pilus assembly protein TadG-related protein [Actinomyces]QPL05019.1 hypothetical protein ID810_09760 [Actinomyces respiraculi]